MSSSVSYRPEIDGLRAIAVLSVVIFHAGFDVLGGGYLGVDVFFVISGYLITKLIRNEYVNNGSFSYLNFYRRRAKRLMPALFFTLIVTFVACFYILVPREFQKFSQSLIYSVFSLSNIFFWKESGYFDTDSQFKPLLHTWSLSVEEQFYIFWPFLLVFLFKYLKDRHALYCIIILTMLSALYSIVMLKIDKSAAYYLTPFRVFELMIGGALVWVEKTNYRNDKLKSICFSLSMIVLLSLFFIYDKNISFPGINAFFVAVLVAFIIFSSNSSAGKFVLASNMMVYIGLISYSLYLAHWPIMALYKYYVMESLSVYESAFLIILSIAIAVFMYHFIERPFRFSSNLPSLFSLKGSLLYGFAICLLILPALHATKNEGWLWRLPEELRKAVADVEKDRSEYWSLISGEVGVFSQDSNKVFVVGNSFAIDIFFAFKGIDDIDVRYSGTTSSECYAFHLKIAPDSQIDCDGNFKKILSLTNAQVADYIVLNERWVIDIPPADYITGLGQAIQQIRAVNSNAKLIIVGPRQTFDQKSAYQLVVEHGRLAGAAEYASKYYYKRQDMLLLNRQLRTYAERIGATFVDLDEIFCKQDVCEILTPEGEMIYWDFGHWTMAGAKNLQQEIIKRFHQKW